ncbi:MAG: hypothetical protein V7K40_07355 [Nostoc sp.]
MHELFVHNLKFVIYVGILFEITYFFLLFITFRLITPKIIATIQATIVHDIAKSKALSEVNAFGNHEINGDINL